MKRSDLKLKASTTTRTEQYGKEKQISMEWLWVYVLEVIH